MRSSQNKVISCESLLPAWMKFAFDRIRKGISRAVHNLVQTSFQEKKKRRQIDQLLDSCLSDHLSSMYYSMPQLVYKGNPPSNIQKSETCSFKASLLSFQVLPKEDTPFFLFFSFRIRWRKSCFRN